MKALSLAAIAAFALSMGAASAADKRPPVYKAPPPPPVMAAPIYNWTGCYVGAGAGYGFANQETELVLNSAFGGAPAGATFINGLTQGGRGWLATAQVGCDLQIGGNWLIGAFVDGDWANIKGRHTGQNINIGLVEGQERLQWSWAIGGRAGYLVNPHLLTFVSAGYTQATFGAVDYNNALFPNFGQPTGLQLPGRKYGGWFIGAGAEYAIGWLPGLFWKNEYRFADYGTRTDTVVCTSAALCGVVGPTIWAERNHAYTHTVRSELVLRFDFGGAGPVYAKY